MMGNEKKKKVSGMSEADKKMFGEKETDLPPPKGFKKSDDKKPMNEGLKKLKKKAPEVVKEMGYKKGGSCSSKSYKKGGMVKRDGCAVRGKTKGRMV